MQIAQRKLRRRGRSAAKEIRFHCLPGTRQALAELMAWSGIEEQGEAITLMIHHLHGLGQGGALPLLTPPRHEYVIPQNVSRKLEFANQREEMRVPIDEI
ncbi:hypothetical protein [Pseudomonas hormoni]|uniref:hypothetical protein n=1 Tax=Pseudomonas hormoni TaxID=3093767 RepID=UPI0020278C6B|nr:hypothetical protein [Pseudomonas hormoni]